MPFAADKHQEEAAAAFSGSLTDEKNMEKKETPAAKVEETMPVKEIN